MTSDENRCMIQDRKNASLGCVALFVTFIPAYRAISSEEELAEALRVYAEHITATHRKDAILSF